MKISEIDQEIREFVEDRLRQNLEVAPRFLAFEIMREHPLGVGGDAEFYEVCAIDTIKRRCRKVLSSFKVSQELRNQESLQMVLPGYERLQLGYMLVREGSSVVVPVGMITYDELTEKATEYYAAAQGQREHADELLRYRDDKFAQAV